jgi:hypothetical protein
MNARLHSTPGQVSPWPREAAIVHPAKGLITTASLVASISGAVNASVCLHLRREAARFALVLRLATRRPPRGLLAELL